MTKSFADNYLGYSGFLYTPSLLEITNRRCLSIWCQFQNSFYFYVFSEIVYHQGRESRICYHMNYNINILIYNRNILVKLILMPFGESDKSYLELCTFNTTGSIVNTAENKKKRTNLSCPHLVVLLRYLYSHGTFRPTQKS